MSTKTSSMSLTAKEEEEVSMQGRLVLLRWYLEGSDVSDAPGYASLAIVSSLDLTKKFLLFEENVVIVTARKAPRLQAVLWIVPYIDMNTESYSNVADIEKSR